MAGQPLQHVTQVGPRIVAVELGRLHQAHDDRSLLASQFAAAEQPCLPEGLGNPSAILSASCCLQWLAEWRAPQLIWAVDLYQALGHDRDTTMEVKVKFKKRYCYTVRFVDGSSAEHDEDDSFFQVS